MNQGKKVIAVVVTYNRKELLKECINALLQQDYDNCDILVVDNASTDGTKEFIADELQNKSNEISDIIDNLKPTMINKNNFTISNEDVVKIKYGLWMMIALFIKIL